jgi:uncharacterized protein (TIGR03000 family)
MNRTGLRTFLAVGLAAFALMLCAVPASAGWWWGAAPACCGSWDYCAPCSYGAYYGGYGWGCHHHRAFRWNYGCGCGWSTCCDPCLSCGTTAYWGTSTYSSCGCGGTVVAPAAPTMAPSAPTLAPSAESPAAAPAAPTAPKAGAAPAAPTTPPLTPPPPGGIVPPTTSLEPSGSDSGVLTVWVPNDAKVTINGLVTKSTGSKRSFVSYGLRPGYTYKYEVKAEVVFEGKVVTDTKLVSLTAGERNGVAFGFNIPSLAQSE